MGKPSRIFSVLGSACLATALVVGVGYALGPSLEPTGTARTTEAPPLPTPGPDSPTTDHTARPLPDPSAAVTLSPTPEPKPTERASPDPLAEPTPEPSRRVEPQPVQEPTRRVEPQPVQEAPAEPKRTRDKPAPVITAVPLKVDEPTLNFTLSTFNTLGHSHTRPGGNKKGWAQSDVRTRFAVTLLNKHGVDVVGFQEFEPPQLNHFRRITSGSFSVYPGVKLGKREAVNSIAWRTGKWELVSAQTIKIPYFNGNLRRMPVVLLRDRNTGLSAYFSNFHNPASVARVGNQQRYRDRATSLQIAMVNRLREETGLPVFVVGDMNERAEYFCRVTAAAGMLAANGGSNQGRCQPPASPGIDWIFGTEGVRFSGFVTDRSQLARRASDHPMVVSKVRLGG